VGGLDTERNARPARLVSLTDRLSRRRHGVTRVITTGARCAIW